MASLQKTSQTFTLNTGAKIPAIGLGTWQSPQEQTAAAVEAALRAGYRHIDTAAAYGNEAAVGEGIRASGVPREEIWLTTKLSNYHHKRAEDALNESLQKLGTSYVDLWLMHWPCSVDPDANPKKAFDDWTYIDTWREMQRLAETGKAKNIGVSNFSITQFEKLLSDPSCKVIPAVNQIELHPGYPAPKLVAYNKDKGIHSTGYSCLGSTDSPLYKNEKLLDIAKSKGKTPQQVLLAWGLQKGWSVIPKSVTASRIEANYDLDGWDLSAEEVQSIDSIKDRFKVCGDGFLPERVLDSNVE